MTDEHASLNLSSCILRGIIGLHYNVIDYYVTVCTRVNWVTYLEPDHLLQIEIRYHVTLIKSLMTVLSLQEMSFFPNYPSLFRDWKHRNKDYNKSRLWIQYNMTKQSCALAQETKRERFQNIMINNSFCKWNYSAMCSFLVNWILEEKHSHNIFGSRVIMIGFRWYLLYLYHHDITVWNATGYSSLMDYLIT